MLSHGCNGKKKDCVLDGILKDMLVISKATYGWKDFKPFTKNF